MAGKLSRLSFETKCCRGIHHPTGSFFRLTEQTQRHTRENRIHTKNYKMRNITTTYIILHSLVRTIKPQNVMYQSTDPGHNHTQYKTMPWHDCRRPHASQWPNPAYHPYYAHTIYVPANYPWSVSTRLVLTRLSVLSPSMTGDHNAYALHQF